LIPVLNTEFSPWPCYTDEEIRAAGEVLSSNRVNYWTGTQCKSFESEFCAWTGAGHAIAVANGTVAIEMALRAAGIGEGDEVVVTPRTFIASVSAAVNVGATPVFADVDRDSQNIRADEIIKVLSRRTRAIVCVHLAGWPCEMDEIRAIASDSGLNVIEDCAQAHGARYRGRSVGTIGDIGAWSFCQDKIITTCGDGGMVTTDDRDLWSRMWSYKEHGKSYDAVHGQDHASGFRWLHTTFGTNFRMTEVQAAVGRIQVARMPQWHSARASNAARLRAASQSTPGLRVPAVPEHIQHAWYKYYVFVEPMRLKSGWNRDRVIHEITAKGVPCYSGSCPEVYLEKAFDGTGFRPKERLAVARELGETSLMFLVHPTLTEQDMHATVAAVAKVMESAAR
jgi:dTDP-4-amino-4,6-dideoxygalactose transaminase